LPIAVIGIECTRESDRPFAIVVDPDWQESVERFDPDSDCGMLEPVLQEMVEKLPLSVEGPQILRELERLFPLGVQLSKRKKAQSIKSNGSFNNFGAFGFCRTNAIDDRDALREF
jgi:hypothetical protein